MDCRIICFIVLPNFSTRGHVEPEILPLVLPLQVPKNAVFQMLFQVCRQGALNLFLTAPFLLNLDVVTKEGNFFFSQTFIRTSSSRLSFLQV